jgi:ABC-type multidrug transport system ATPase subunit
VLEAERLGKRFGSRWIFRGLSFGVAPGQSLLLLGANGSGKSTLLKVLAGLLPPSEGEVRPPDGDPRQAIAYAGLDQSLYPQLTCIEHLEIAARLRGMGSDAPAPEKLLATVGLEDAARKPAAELSSGMRARLKLALALQPGPGLLLLDEPGASLDEQGRVLVRELCREQRKRGALVIATNDPAERELGTHEILLGD